MLENKFVRTLLCFLLMVHTLFYTWSCSWFYTRCTFMVLLTVSSHGPTHGFFSWFYSSSLPTVLLMVYVHGSTLVSSYGSVHGSIYVLCSWFFS